MFASSGEEIVPLRTLRLPITHSLLYKHSIRLVRVGDSQVLRFTLASCKYKRGTAEQWIKEGKQATHWTRLSCHRLAYNLGNLWLRLVLPKRIDAWSVTDLRQLSVKTGRHLVKHVWYLLAVAGRKSPDATPVRDDAAADLGVACADRVVL
jgi:hypothetical protein